MTNGEARPDAIDPKTVFASKYTGEADAVAKLLEQNPTEAVTRLQQDAHLQPHEFHAFMKQVQTDYAADKSKNPNLPDVIFSDDKNGIKVGVAKEGEKEIPIIFEVKPEDLAKGSDKPIPKTGEVLGLTKEQTDQVLAVQAKEKAASNGDPKQVHKFGDIAVSLGMKTPEEVNAALDKQDHLRAAQTAKDLSTSMPIGKGEGYYQVVKRTHPDLTDDAALKLAHVMKKLNHGKEHLVAGQALPVMNAKEKAEVEALAYADAHKRTGQVKAKPGQALSEIPPG